MEKAEDITVRVSIPRLRPEVSDESLEQQSGQLSEELDKRRDEDITRRIRKA